MAGYPLRNFENRIETLLQSHGVGLCAFLFVMGWLILFGPVYIDFMQELWTREENTHGPFIVAICAGLAYAKLSSGEMRATRNFMERAAGFGILLLGLLAYSWSRIQEVELVLSGSQIIIASGATLSIFGLAGFRQLWFVFALSIYLVAWPGWAIDLVTFPLKIFVSEIVTNVLYQIGVPISHDGAVITIGVYELLVADACAGLNSLIALTSIGVVYLYIVKRQSLWANLFILMMLAPIAVLANIVRVALLVMITWMFGYDVGQSFFHDLSGFVMFGIALLAVFALDSVGYRISCNNAERMK